jgi:hypothetical protein
VENDIDSQEGIIDKSEIVNGVYLASSLTKVNGNYVVTSMLNTKEAEVLLEMPTLKLEIYDTEKFSERGPNEHVGSLASLRKEDEKPNS